MNIYGYLHLVKMYREYVVLKEMGMGNENKLKELSTKVDLYGLKFRDISCSDCDNNLKCQTKQPSYDCYEFTPRS
jgi:hypothetical protein